jgi:hypothetical protein
MGIINEARRREYVQGLMDHARAVDEKLATLPPDIAATIRKTYQLQLYPLGFIDTIAAKLLAESQGDPR